MVRLELRRRARVGTIGAALLIAACQNIHASGYRTTPAATKAFRGTVTLSATAVPTGAQELGIVQTSSTTASLSDLAAQFRAEVAKLGGNFGKVDVVRTHFETIVSPQFVYYGCGRAMCGSTRSRRSEVGTTTIQGRAFLIRGAEKTHEEPL